MLNKNLAFSHTLLILSNIYAVALDQIAKYGRSVTKITFPDSMEVFYVQIKSPKVKNELQRHFFLV